MTVLASTLLTTAWKAQAEARDREPARTETIFDESLKVVKEKIQAAQQNEIGLAPDTDGLPFQPESREFSDVPVVPDTRDGDAEHGLQGALLTQKLVFSMLFGPAGTHISEVPVAPDRDRTA